MTIQVRFSQFVRRGPGCWEWTGARNPAGYGRFFVYWQPGKGTHAVLAHRLAWEFARGEIPKGLCVLHRCDNPRCVNPDHLFLGTQIDNIRDMVVKGRSKRGPNPLRGERSPRAKLDLARVEWARRVAARGLLSCPDIAWLIGISDTEVRNIVNRRVWLPL